MKKRLLCLTLALLALMTVCLASCKKETPQPQFVPPAFDSNAVAGVPAIAEGENGYSVLDARGVYKVGVCGVVKVVDKKVDVWFTSPAENTVWLKLRVQDKKTGKILGETGLIKPGEYVQSVTFSDFPEAGNAITLRVMSYEPETYYSRGEVTLNTTLS